MRKWEDSLNERLAASPEYVVEYLRAVLEESDAKALRLALRHIAETQLSQSKKSSDEDQSGLANG
jgi:DNA-binding phage protein